MKLNIQPITKNNITLSLIHENDVEEYAKLLLKNKKWLSDKTSWVPASNSLPDLISAIKQSIKHLYIDDIKNIRAITFVIKNDKNKIIGIMYVGVEDFQVPAFSIGYWIDELHSNKGYMHTSVAIIEDILFNQLQAKRIEIKCDIKNLASAKIANKNNFEFEGTNKKASMLNGEIIDVCCYAKIAN